MLSPYFGHGNTPFRCLFGMHTTYTLSLYFGLLRTKKKDKRRSVLPFCGWERHCLIFVRDTFCAARAKCTGPTMALVYTVVCLASSCPHKVLCTTSTVPAFIWTENGVDDESVHASSMSLLSPSIFQGRNIRFLEENKFVTTTFTHKVTREGCLVNVVLLPHSAIANMFRKCCYLPGQRTSSSYSQPLVLVRRGYCRLLDSRQPLITDHAGVE